jgi:hypothetical protein
MKYSTSAVGTNAKWRNVRFRAAVGVIADVTKTLSERPLLSRTALRRRTGAVERLAYTR